MNRNAVSPEGGFADPAALVIDALNAFLPPEPISTADYAAQHRWLANEGGGYVGPWLHENAPYLVEPMEALDSYDYTDVAVVGPGQCAKTSIAENWLLKSVGADPANFLWYMQTEDVLNHYVKTTINPMIELHPVLAGRLGLAPTDDSLKFKRFRGMSCSFLPATYSNTISKRAPRIVVDEIDAAPESLGDLRALLDVRRTTYGADSMILSISHPDRATSVSEEGWTDGIMKSYRASDRRTWWWPCWQCGEFSSPNPNASLVMTLDYPKDAPADEIREAARLLCPHCGGLVEDKRRRAMNAAAAWVGLGQHVNNKGEVLGQREPRKIAGFWILGVMSTLGNRTIGDLAAELVEADRDRVATGDEKPLRDVTVKKIGIPYTPPKKVSQIDADTLASRAEPGLRIGIVPEGVRFLTAAADIQANRFEWLVRGWGENGESWLIDHRRVMADPATSPTDWDDLLRVLYAQAYPLADDADGRVMRIHAIGYDTGGQPGVTTQAYSAWLRARQAGRVRLPVKIDGREAWRLLPLKGMPGAHAQRLAIVYPDAQRRSDRHAGARGQVPTGQFAANQFKDDLAGHLAVGAPGPWMLHLPANPVAHLVPREADEETRQAARKAWFAQLTAEQRKPNGSWEKVTANARNEVWDMMAMTHVMAHLHGLARLRWAAPPAWAAPWDRNTHVTAPDAAEKDAAPPATPLPGAAVAAQPNNLAARRSAAARFAN